MEEKIIEIANEKLYYSKLDNGLEVYMIPNNNVKNVYATFTTKYGSIHDEFVPINSNKMIYYISINIVKYIILLFYFIFLRTID